MTTAPPLPEAGPALLLRALCKRGHAAMPPAPLESAYSLPRIDADRLARYNALLGFASDALPLTFYYLIAQRAHLASMLDAAFPFRLAGMIHAENALHEIRRPALDRPLAIKTRLEIEAPTERGARYCTLASRAEQDGADIFACTSRYLAQRGESSRKSNVPPAEQETLPLLAAWHLEADSGVRYAAVSGDWNLIHLRRWSARLFGLPAPIIHGMHTMAAACARLERAQATRVTSMSARFKAPIALGSEAELFAGGGTGAYRVRCGTTIAVAGSFS